jgi:TrbC/VIRB2 pilin
MLFATKRPIARAFSLGAGVLSSARALAQENPFDQANTVLTDWTQQATTVAISAAGLAGVVVIGMAIFGYLRAGWAFRIGIGLVALSGLGWIIQQLSGGV